MEAANAANKSNQSQITAPADPLMAKVKAAFASRGAKGIMGLGKLFRMMDEDGSNTLTFPVFSKAMSHMSLNLTEPEMVRLFKKFG